MLQQQHEVLAWISVVPAVKVVCQIDFSIVAGVAGSKSAAVDAG